MTLETKNDGKFLLRLEHMYDYGEDSVLSQPVTISLDVIKE
jgi:lysosomal alpha-mannosidase